MHYSRIFSLSEQNKHKTTFSIQKKWKKNVILSVLCVLSSIQCVRATEQPLRYCNSQNGHTPDLYLTERSVGRVWGGGKGEGNVPTVRASTQPDTPVGTVRFCTLYTKVFCRSKSRLRSFYILVWYLLWVLHARRSYLVYSLSVIPLEQNFISRESTKYLGYFSIVECKQLPKHYIQ